MTRVTRPVWILVEPMKVAALTLLALALAAAASAAGAATTSNSGTLSVEGASGVVTVVGRGALLGRIASGSVKIVDLSQADRWEPMINGIAGIEAYPLKGENMTFRILGGDYRIVIRGKGISIAARGRGIAVVDGDPSAGGLTGIWSVGRDVDCRRAAELCEPVPDIARKIAFGPPATAVGNKAS